MIEAATVGVGSSNNRLKQFTVRFPVPFPVIPVVVANALQSEGFQAGSISDTFAVTITSVSLNGFTANIFRVDSTVSGWGQNLFLGYIAMLPGVK